LNDSSLKSTRYLTFSLSKKTLSTVK